MSLENIRKEHELIDLFCNLAEIPSPSMHEEKVAEWIREYCDKNGINCKFDDFKKCNNKYSRNRQHERTFNAFRTYGCNRR